MRRIETSRGPIFEVEVPLKGEPKAHREKLEELAKAHNAMNLDGIHVLIAAHFDGFIVRFRNETFAAAFAADAE